MRAAGAASGRDCKAAAPTTRALPGREVPQRAPQALLVRVLEGGAVEIGEMAGRAVGEPFKPDLDLVRQEFDELLDRAEVVLVRRRTDAAGHAVLVAVDASVLGRDPHRTLGFVESDDEGSEFSVALIVAAARDRLGGERGREKRGESRKRQWGAVHSIPDGYESNEPTWPLERLCAATPQFQLFSKRGENGPAGCRPWGWIIAGARA